MFIQNEVHEQATAVQVELQNAGESKNIQPYATDPYLAQLPTNEQCNAHTPTGSATVSTSGDQMMIFMYIRALLQQFGQDKDKIMEQIQFSFHIIVNQ